MSTILIICNDEPFRNRLRNAVGTQNRAVVGVPNTKDILFPRSAREASGYDLIVAEIQPRDHDGLSRLVLFRNLHPNTPFLVITREDQTRGGAYESAAARALHAQLIALPTESLDELKDAAARALPGTLPRSH